MQTFLDATDLANVALHVALGIHNQAKYSVLARHSMAVTEMNLSKARRYSLAPEHRAAFERACNAMSEGLKGSLSEEDVATFRAMTADVWVDWGAKGGDAQASVDSHNAFLSSLGLTN